MSIVVGENSYSNVADADAYFAARDVASWSAATNAAREAALLQATAYLDGHYDWVGVLADTDQLLGWPRHGATDGEGRLVEGIPARIRAACAEIALAALKEDIAPTLHRGGKVSSESVGDVSIQYAEDAPVGKTFPYVDLLLKGLFRAPSTAVQVRRI